MKLSLIVAAAENNVIGVDGHLPWSLPDDMKHFKECTIGRPVIMGRKTYESIPAKFRPLPDRRNIVVTRQADYDAPGCVVVHSLEEALDDARQSGAEEACVIGGSSLYALALPLADIIHLTRVHEVLEGDAVFAHIDPAQWREVAREEHPADERHAFSFAFVTYERVV
jgi:dihydrofolate reductase